MKASSVPENKSLLLFAFKENKNTSASRLTLFSNPRKWVKRFWGFFFFFLPFAEQSPTNLNNADAWAARQEISSVSIQENIILTKNNPKFSFQTVFLGNVQGLRMIHKSPCLPGLWNQEHRAHPAAWAQHSQQKDPALPFETPPPTQQRAPLTPHRSEAESHFHVCFIVSSSGLIYSSLQVLFVSAAKIKFMATPFSQSL